MKGRDLALQRLDLLMRGGELLRALAGLRLPRGMETGQVGEQAIDPDLQGTGLGLRISAPGE